MEIKVKLHNVQQIDFEGPNMVLTVDDQVYRVDLASVSERLAKAGDDARRSYSVSPSGYGIHWPEVDEDLTVDGLIASHPKTEETGYALKEESSGKPSLLRQHLRRVIEHVQTTQGRFCKLMENGLKTMPIPFFGDIEKAEVLTIGVNPAASEFYDGRNWPPIDATAEYLEPRLRNYFLPQPPYPEPHPWFCSWEKSLHSLNECSYRVNAAHLDLSPRATYAMGGLPVEEFLEMVKADLGIFFETLLLCKQAKVLLLAGTVTSAFYLNEFLRVCSPDFGFELQGPFRKRRCVEGMTCRDSLVGPKLDRPLPVFFFSRSPSYRIKDDLVRFVSGRSQEICYCLNNL